MFFTFLSHQFKEFWRGRNKGSSITVKVVMLLLVVYLLLVALLVGSALDELIRRGFPNDEPVHIFNGFILYYFMFDFLARIQLQELPTVSIQPYLSLNIRKNSIIRFLNLKTLPSFFNLAALFIFLPFCFWEIDQVFGTASAIAMAVCIVSLTLFNNFLALWFKRKGGSNPWLLLSGVVLVLTLALLDFMKIISVAAASDRIFSLVLRWPLLAVVFFALAAFALLLNSRHLTNNLYVEELSARKEKRVSTEYPFFKRFGRVGYLAANEFKLILRNKRSKSLLLLSSLMMFYGLIFYDADTLARNNFTLLLFVSIFITGIFQISYGQFMFGWQSNHFDGLMSNPINFADFMRAKFLLLTLAASTIMLVTLLYGLISWKLILLHVSAYLYNIGFGSVIILFFANFNRKRLDLSRGSSFNWQGVGATQWFMAIPIVFIPYLIYLPFARSGFPYWGLISIGIFGLVTLAMRELWVRWLTNMFIQQRYKIAEGFRE